MILRETRHLRQWAAQRAAALAARLAPDDHGLAAVLDAWLSLPRAIRAGMLAMVRASE